MDRSNDEEDAAIMDRWVEFRSNYEELGYRRVSYEYFAKWLPNVYSDLPSYEPTELKRRLHAYKKRLRLRKPEKDE